MSKEQEKKGELKASAKVDQSLFESVCQFNVKDLENASSSVQSVFPGWRQRDKQFLRFHSKYKPDFRLMYLLCRYSMHYLVHEAEQQSQGENSNYRPHIAGVFEFPVPLGPAPFIRALQCRLSEFDGLFEEVFCNEPSRWHVKVPAQSHLVFRNDILEKHHLQKEFGCMAQFWHIFRSLQDIVDNIAAHVPESREHLCQIASMDMVEVLEMYCSCYDGDLLLLKSEGGGEHTDLKEFSVAAADLFSVSEFLPFFDDAYTILAQFFLIVDMCVGKELSSSAVSRSSDEWKSVVFEAKRMFNPSFYKCDVNEFRRRVVKPVPLQCPHVQPSKTKHQSMSVKPPPPSPPSPPPSPSSPSPSCIRIHYICSALLLENLEKLLAVIQYCDSVVVHFTESGKFESESSKPISVVHRLYRDATVMFYAVFRRILILFDLGHYTRSVSCHLEICTLPSISHFDVLNGFSLLYHLQSYYRGYCSIGRSSGVLLNIADDWKLLRAIKDIKSFAEHDIEEYSKMLGKCKAVLPGDHSSIDSYLKHVEETVRRPAAPLHPRNETTASTLFHEDSATRAADCSSANDIQEQVKKSVPSKASTRTPQNVTSAMGSPQLGMEPSVSTCASSCAASAGAQEHSPRRMASCSRSTNSTKRRSRARPKVMHWHWKKMFPEYRIPGHAMESHPGYSPNAASSADKRERHDVVNATNCVHSASSKDVTTVTTELDKCSLNCGLPPTRYRERLKDFLTSGS